MEAWVCKPLPRAWSSGMCLDRWTGLMFLICLRPSPLTPPTARLARMSCHQPAPAGFGQWEAALESGGGMQRGPRMFILRAPFPLWGSSLALLVITQLVAQSYPTLCDPMDHSPPGSSVRGILQARILEWIALSSSRGPS